MKYTFVIALLLALICLTSATTVFTNLKACKKCFKKKDFLKRHLCITKCVVRKTKSITYLHRCNNKCRKIKRKNRKYCKAACNVKRVYKVCKKRLRRKCSSMRGWKVRKCFKAGGKFCFKYKFAYKKLNSIAKGKFCKIDDICGAGNYCSKNGVLITKYGYCVKKYPGWCRSNDNCKGGKVCVAFVENGRGRCKKKSSLPRRSVVKGGRNKEVSSNASYEDIRDAHDFVKATEVQSLQSMTKIDSNEDVGEQDEVRVMSCGNDVMDFSHLTADQNTLAAGCGTTICDNPSKRNSYTGRLNGKLDVLLIIPSCGSFNQNQITTGVPRMVNLLNREFSNVKVTFTFRTQKVGGCASSLDQAIRYWGGPHRGKKYLTMFVLPTRSGGQMKFPWMKDHGFGHVADWIFREEKYMHTISHEMGHSFGLWHTFHGVSEIGGCGGCRETSTSSADTKGDFCSDTPPHPRTGECARRVSTSPGCRNTPRTWNHALNNLMSYSYFCAGNRVFSHQQTMRMRCYFQNYFGKFVNSSSTVSKKRCAYKNTVHLGFIIYSGVSYRCYDGKWRKEAKPQAKKKCAYKNTPHGATITYRGTRYKCNDGKWLRV